MTLTHELLARFSPFNTLAYEYLSKVIEKASLKEYSKGAIIFKRGKALNHSLYLVSGSVDLIDSQFAVISITSEDDSHKVPLNSASPTQVSAVAKSSVVVLSVESDFSDLDKVKSNIKTAKISFYISDILLTPFSIAKPMIVLVALSIKIS